MLKIVPANLPSEEDVDENYAKMMMIKQRSSIGKY